MRRYDSTDLTPKISLSVDESWYEKYWLTDRPDLALARLWRKLRVVLGSDAAIARPWPRLDFERSYSSEGNTS
jgi:hypothetical protein